MSDLVKDTAQRLNIEPKVLFKRVAYQKGFTNADEVASDRFQRWLKFGEVPSYVSDYCLDQWREVAAK